MAMVLRALALAVACALLLSGCVSEPKPTEGVQGIVVQSAEGLIGEIQPAKTEPQPEVHPQNATQERINCTLAVKQPVIVAGEQVDITLNSRFQGSAIFDLACGDETRRLVSDDTLTLETKCRFDAPGTHTIVVNANGRECASATVEVRKKAGGTCSIDSASIERDFSSYYYKWTVYFDGFSDGDVLKWVCGNTVASKRITSDPIWGMPRLEVLSCDFPSAPAEDYIDVSIGGVLCGKVSTRQ